MEVNGTWMSYGKFALNKKPIKIDGNEITYWKSVGREEPEEVTSKFVLEKDQAYMPSENCHNLKIEGDEYRALDYMVHEETIGEKKVAILSFMGMEYDGRGRIVLSSFVREEDLGLVNEDFESKAVKYWNKRPAIPMTNINAKGPFTMPVMGGMMALNGMQLIPQTP